RGRRAFARRQPGRAIVDRPHPAAREVALAGADDVEARADDGLQVRADVREIADERDADRNAEPAARIEGRRPGRCVARFAPVAAELAHLRGCLRGEILDDLVGADRVGIELLLGPGWIADA